MSRERDSKERLRRAAEAELESLRDLGVEFLSGVPPSPASIGKATGAAAAPPARPPVRATSDAPPARAAEAAPAGLAPRSVARAESPLFATPRTGQAPGGGPPLPSDPAAVASELAALGDRVRDCRLCPLLSCRTNAVPGEGPAVVDLMFIGEAPGAEEDQQGRPFVGRAGQLLTKMIEAIRFRRDEVFIANVLKCRPPDNRPPQPDEIANCLPFLTRQIALLRPKIVCTLGLHATQTVLSSKASMGQLRGRVFELPSSPARVVPTYHPAYLLRSPGEKVKAWEDLKLVASLLGRPV